MPNIQLKRGDIVWVDLRGADGGEKQGERPCLVVQNDVGNQHSPLTIVAPITDARQDKALPVQVPVTPADSSVLTKDSIVECGHLRTIDRDARITRHGGQLSTDAMKRVDVALKRSLGLGR